MAKYKEFRVVLERQPDDGYAVYVPELPGCISQGDTRAEAMKNIKEAIELYLSDLTKEELGSLRNRVSIATAKVSALA
ncbi:MAG: type II toxin-antitoxin system HicB family antitoxin [Candidatus Diapherotrites archaeon]|uniref:Type II toxin-antitoxin system HicB family antitoxin n=1 Tax=Candidatus Iainarchaeum sp. TaxID=3101447 RepID=A0A8T3YKK1_9ARCH|nr:type II toxin-antitoxin system HicB family antitoxin [Candidatus Diapherotrites archaeon]